MGGLGRRNARGGRADRTVDAQPNARGDGRLEERAGLRFARCLRRIAVTPFELVCALGLSCNLVWCTLEGHADGFLTSAQGFDFIANSRIFFQLGLVIAAAAMCAAPRALRRADPALAWTIPLAAALATFLYAWPMRLGPLGPETVCALGLTTSGIGYCWLVARFYLMMAQRRGFTSCVVATALCLGIKEILLSFLSSVPPQNVQVCIAAAMPVCMSALYAAASHMAQGDERSETATGTAFGRERFGAAYVLVLALLMAVIRGFSRLGMWGTEAPGAVGLGVPIATALLSVCAVAVFAVFALIMPADRPAHARFRPATLVLLAGLFPIAFQTYLGADAIPYVFLQVIELLAHLTFWSAVCALIQDSAEPTLRTTGVPLLVYSVTSAVMVVLMSRTTVLAFVFALLIVYLLFVAFTGRAPAELATPRAAGPAGARTQTGLPGAPQTSGSPEAAAPDSGATLTDAVGRTCDLLAETYALSPREAQILPMVVEGRSRAYICEQLGLSDSTVKTHISHIYGKCSVAGRQGLVELVFRASQP